VGRSGAGASLAALALVVAFALLTLALQGNWPKALRVALAFLAYAAVLVVALRAPILRSTGSRECGPVPFLLAGAAAGLTSELVRGTAAAALVALGVAGGMLLGSVHWLGLRRWRRAPGAASPSP